MFSYLQRGAENPYAVQSIISGGVVATFDEGASELLFGGRPLLAESRETGLLQRSVQLLQAVRAVRRFLFGLRPPAAGFPHLLFLLFLLLFLVEMSSWPQSAVRVCVSVCTSVAVRVSTVCVAVAWEALAALLVSVMAGPGLLAVRQWKWPIAFQRTPALGGKRSLPVLVR